MASKSKISSALALLGAAAFTFGASGVNAAWISSESFQTTIDGADGTYNSAAGNGEIAQPDNQGVTVGNSGFSASNRWGPLSGSIRTHTSSLTHSGVTGVSRSGSARMLLTAANGGLNRNSSRRLATEPVLASSYYFSGLIAGVAADRLVDGSAFTAGFMGSLADNTFNVDTGFHFGLHKDSGVNYLAAFANGSAYNLLALDAGTNLANTYQVVLRLDVDAAGNDLLSAWYAEDGATGLAQGLEATDVGDIWSGAGSLGVLALQTRNEGLGGTNIVGSIDELRFGTSLSDVTVIPEPGTIGLLAGLAMMGLVAARRARRAK